MAPPTATATTTSTAMYKEGPKEEVVRMDATQREDEGEMDRQVRYHSHHLTLLEIRILASNERQRSTLIAKLPLRMEPQSQRDWSNSWMVIWCSEQGKKHKAQL